MGGEVAPAPPQTGARGLALAMFCVLLASYVINAMDRQLFPMLVPEVRREYSFSLADVGLLSTVFTFGMAVAGLPTGYLLARFSRKSVLQVGIALFSVCTALTVLASGFSDMLMYRAATGIGESMQLTILLAIAANYFIKHRSAALGSVNFSFGIGAIISPILGGSVFTFGLILCLVLLGIGIGGLMYAMQSAGRPARLWAFAMTCLLEAAFVMVAYAIGDRLARAHLRVAPTQVQRRPRGLVALQPGPLGRGPHPSTHRGDLRVRELGEQLFQPVRLRAAVAVQEGEHVAARRLRSQVAGRRRAQGAVQAALAADAKAVG